MDLIITTLTVAQSFSISLGVGASTLAVLNFFAAIADGTISDTERRMMGVVYTVLRVAMVAILLTTLTIIAITEPDLLTLSGYTSATLIIVAVLYGNAILMTTHLIPTTIGPALQASSWYTLGILGAIAPLGYTQYPLWSYLLGYAAVFLLAVAIINGCMAWMKQRAQTRAQPTADVTDPRAVE
jgi:hypothetical protein